MSHVRHHVHFEGLEILILMEKNQIKYKISRSSILHKVLLDDLNSEAIITDPESDSYQYGVVIFLMEIIKHIIIIVLDSKSISFSNK
jgi:hypothetical protein